MDREPGTRSAWPLLGTGALLLLVIGALRVLHAQPWASPPLLAGALLLAWMLYGWFGAVIRDAGPAGEAGDRALRWGMAWFIASEAALFAALFGALIYARWLAVPWLAGAGDHDFTRALLWPGFRPDWPPLPTPEPGAYRQPSGQVNMLGVPLVITLVLLASAYAVTWAQWGLQRSRRGRFVAGLVLTIALGAVFLGFQLHEYWLNDRQLNLGPASGIYGATFYALTGFHCAHVTVGLIALAVMLRRALRGDFAPEDHFGFEATAWYWHFVDVVWLWLYVLVYWF